jgi:hypothetical protein
MGIDYLPVMLSIDHPHPELEQWVADRFEMLNGRKMQIVRRTDMPEAIQNVYPSYMKAWLWDVVPKTVERILFIDWDVIPLRSMPMLPDVPFAAAPDDQMFIDRRVGDYPILTATNCYFNAGFFIARRDTLPIFEQVKLFAFNKINEDQTRGDFEQTVLNLLMQTSVGVTWMPYAYNVISLFAGAAGAKGVINLHLNSLSMSTRWVVMNIFRTAIGLSKLPEKE